MNVTVGKVLLGMINDQSTLYCILATIRLGISGLVLLLMDQAGITLSIIGGSLFVWTYAGVSVQTPMLVCFVFKNKNYAYIYLRMNCLQIKEYVKCQYGDNLPLKQLAQVSERSLYTFHRDL